MCDYKVITRDNMSNLPQYMRGKAYTKKKNNAPRMIEIVKKKPKHRKCKTRFRDPQAIKQFVTQALNKSI